MKKLIMLLSVGFSISTFAQQSGDVVSFEQKLNLTPSGVVNYLSGNLGDAGNNTDVSDYLRSFDVGLKAYKITYYTKGLNNSLVKATGLLMYPNVDFKLSTVVSEHPTTDSRENVPSNLKGIYSVGFILELSYALNGYIVMAPDYVGMGSGDDVHPYVHYLTEAGATVDFVKAANTVLAQLNIKRYDEYFITGYSQGAHATMSTLKYLSTNNPTNLKFKYAFAGDGPYDLSGTTLNEGFLQKTNYPSTAFLAALMGTCQNAGFNIYPGSNYAAVIAPAYQELYNYHVIQDNGGLDWGPKIWRTLLKPEFVSDLTNNQNANARKCLKANDVANWYNKTPMTMGTSTIDQTIPPNNSYKTVTAQRAYYPWYDLGKYDITSLSWGPLDHAGGAIPFVIASNAKFNTLRSGGFFNQWAYLFTKNANDKQTQEDVNSSMLKPQFDNLQINEVVDFNQVKSTSKNITTNTDISKLKEGVYLLKANDGKQTKYIPYIKSNPINVEENEIVQSENNGILNLKVKTEELKNINIFNTSMELVTSISQADYLANKGIELKDLSGEYTIEVVSTYNALQFKKMIGNPADIASEVIFAARQNQILIQSRGNINSVKVYNMNGSLLENQSINTKEYQTKSLQPGIYIINLVLENGKTVTGKVKI